jgi:hypothetical protein
MPDLPAIRAEAAACRSHVKTEKQTINTSVQNALGEKVGAWKREGRRQHCGRPNLGCRGSSLALFFFSNHALTLRFGSLSKIVALGGTVEERTEAKTETRREIVEDHTWAAAAATLRCSSSRILR